MAKIELKKETSELHITVSADKITWQSAQEKAFKKLKSSLTLKGFRKGQAPDTVARKSIAKTEIFTEALKTELDILVKAAAKEIKADLLILDSPSYNVEKINEEQLTVTFIYPVYPEVKLPDYKKLDIKFESKQTTSESIEEEVSKILESQTKMESKEGKLAKGDVAVFDFEGFIDGTPFPGGKAANYELEIGSGQFIAGFEDQMIGLSKGESKDVNVSFPEEYHVPELKAKPAVFKIKLNDIKAKVKPKLNDELVKTLNIPAVKNVAELKDYIKEIQNNELSMQARGAFQRQAFDKITEQASIAIPAQLIAKEMHQQENNFAVKLKQQGLSIKQYMDMSGQTKETILSQLKKAAETRLRDSFIFAEIAKLEKIEFKDEDYEKEYVKFAKIYGQTVEAIKGMVQKTQMQIPMTNDRVIDILIAANKQ